MGIYVGVRGRLQCDAPQLAQVREIVRSDTDRAYSGAWSFPEQHYNWTHYVFYGADIRESGVDALLEQLQVIARIPPSDEDNDLVTGLFLASHETTGLNEWQIREGGIHIARASDDYRYLDQ
ncbi:hypothetical protein OHA88_04320 [Streptomyces sp. NBC_00353]|uniref:hypothetical protein n=1 Tax=Streptomyces sp. NBC_00353 TaxID=2975722 RepID=UPI002E2616CF